MTTSTYENGAELSRHRKIDLFVRRAFRQPGRTFVVLAMAPVLAVGALALSPEVAHAVPTPEASTPLPQGQQIPSTMVATGSSFVWDTLRSSDGGTTWNADPALATRPSWDFVGGGKMARVVNGTTPKAYVYTPSSGTQQTYDVASGAFAINGTYVSYGTTIYNMVTTATTSLTLPTGAPPDNWSQELSSSDAILWHGNGSDDQYNLFAVSPNPSTAPGAWVTLSNYKDYQLTDTDFLYLVAGPSALTLCRRSLASFATALPCATVANGNYSSGYSLTVTNLGALNLVQVQADGSLSSQAYIVPTSLATVSPVQVGSGSTVSNALLGGAPYLVVLDANTVPRVNVVAANGALTPSFAIPATQTIPPWYLAVTPDRVVGGDPRDGSRSVPVWSRTVSGSGFGTETALPQRASGVWASAGRTAILNKSGLSVYDGATLQHTFADQAQIGFVGLSGPYVVEGLVDANNTFSTKVSKADGTPVVTVAGWAAAVFGSQLISTSVDSAPSGVMHVVVRDLISLAVSSYDLPAGTAGCWAADVWGTSIALNCSFDTWANTTRVYNYKTKALLGSTPGTAESLGDGYAVVNVGSTYSVWKITANALISTGCNASNAIEATDGVGHVACSSDTNLIWQDYSSVSTSAPRLLGVLATPTASFSQPGSTWSLAMDTTKALAGNGQVRITTGATPGGTLVRTLTTPASTDGSIRVTWDGLDDHGKPVPAGPYTYTLAASGADASGTALAIDGTTPASGTVTVTAASTLGMASGGFATLPPSRLLDTRVSAPKLGAGATRTLQVTGVGGVPTTGVSAVVLNVTVTETTSGGYLTVSPTGSTRPVVSNLNWSAGATIPNAVTVKVGTNGQVDLYQSGPGSAQVIVDVAGYFIGGSAPDPGGFSAIAPSRILDTRTTGGKIAANTSRDLQVTGAGGVPDTGVSAVVLNVTVTETTAGGYLTVYPQGSPKPLASNLNWAGGATIPNLVTVKVGDTGKVSLYQSGPGTAQVIVDVAGYYVGGTATLPGTFVALAPARVLDTRSTGAVAANSDLSLTILGKGGIPASGVSAVVINTTVTETTAPGYLTVYPGTSTLPTASNLNWSGAGTTIPNLVTTQVGSDGTIKFHNGSSGTTQVIADTAGYYLSY